MLQVARVHFLYCLKHRVLCEVLAKKQPINRDDIQPPTKAWLEVQLIYLHFHSIYIYNLKRKYRGRSDSFPSVC